MPKLTPDEIKWILSIDTKGVNRDIAVVSSEIYKLSNANKDLTKELKAAERYMNSAEAAMLKMEQSGKTTSKAYGFAKISFDQNSKAVLELKAKIEQNDAAIKKHKKSIEDMEKGIKLSEMSMRQLRSRAAELQKQLNVTSYSANRKEYKALQKELSKVETRMFDVSTKGKGLINQFATMNNPVGSAAKSVLGFEQALKVIVKNPVGIVISALVVAFLALKKAITSSEENMNKFQQLLTPLKVLFDALLLIVQKAAGAILDFAIKALDGLTKLAEKIPFVGGKMKELNDKAKEGIELEKQKQQLRIRERETLVTNAKKERDIAELRNKAKQRDKYSNKEIIGFLEAAIKKEDEIAKEKIEQAEISLRILEAEAARAQNTEEINRQIAEQKALLYNLETEFFNKTRRNESELFSRREEMRREDEAAAKEALDRKIAAIDYSLKEETKLLKQQLADRSITQEQYDRELEQKTIESLQRKLEIAGLDQDARIDIEQQVLDFKIKAIELEKQLEKERADMAKNIRTSFMDKDNQELEAIREKYSKRNEELRLFLEKQAITELEYTQNKAIIVEEQEKELEEKRKAQREAHAAQRLVEQNEEYEAEKMQLTEQYATGLLDKQTYNDFLLKLDEEYALRSLEISNLSDKQKLAASKKLLDMMIKQNEEETKKQEEEQKKRAALYSQFSEQIGTMLGGIIAGNEDIVKTSLKTIINMALDALEAQITMAIASATAQSFAQADSVATFGASGAARAAILTALIKGAFAGVKAIVNSTMSGSKKPEAEPTTPTATGARVIIGRQSGGYFPVKRDQDKKRYIAKFDPARRGFINRPTVLVGEGPAGKSMEWVAGNDALQNPTVAPLIRLLDEAQQAGNIRTIDLNHLMRARMAGFASGGFISQPASVETPHVTFTHETPDNASINSILTDIRDFLKYLKTNGVKAPVVLSELQRKQELLNASQKIGSK